MEFYSQDTNREKRHLNNNFKTMITDVSESTPICTEKTSFNSLFKQKWHPTLVYCSVFWSFGMSVAFLGPTLRDLGCQTSTDFNHISWVFFAQLICTLIGSIIAGCLMKRCSADLVLLVCTAILPLSMFIIPFCQVLAGLGFVLAVMGLQMGAIDCIANLQMIRLYGEMVTPFLQGLHFSYGLGAFVSPMIAEPFLLNEDCSQFIDNYNTKIKNSTNGTLIKVFTNATGPAHSLEEAQEMTKVRFAFWIMALLQLPIPFLVATMSCSTFMSHIKSLKSGHHELVNSESSVSLGPEKQDLKQLQHLPNQPRGEFLIQRWQTVMISLLTAVMVFLYDGLQSEYGGYVYSYATKSKILDMSSSEGAYLNAAFWGCFAFGRLLSIPIATKFSPAFMLLCNIVGSVIPMIVMLALRHDHTALYIGTCMFGLALSRVAPTALSLAEQFIDVNSSITTFIIVMAAVGESVFPVIVGHLFAHLGAISFLVFGVIITCVSVPLYLAIVFVGRRTTKHEALNGSSFVWCTNKVNVSNTHGQTNGGMTFDLQNCQPWKPSLDETPINDGLSEAE